MEFGMQFFPCVEPEEKDASQYFSECLELVGRHLDSIISR